VMHRTGLAPYGQEDDAVRWIAVLHGDDHVHIVAMLARQDGVRGGATTGTGSGSVPGGKSPAAAAAGSEQEFFALLRVPPRSR
jgi:hypothetical protein